MVGSPKGAKTGKKKLTKAQRERLKKEEEERLVKEAEEAAVRAAEEERVRKTIEAELAEDRKKIENEERRVRMVLMAELQQLVDSHNNFLHDHKLNKFKDNKWARYMRCDGSPDPTILGEINTYINLKLEDTSRDDIDSVLNDSKLDLALIDELENLIHDTPEEFIDENLTQQYNETIADLHGLLSTKLDRATHTVLLAASDLQHQETSNLHYHRESSGITLSVWANLAKNPRIRSFDFVQRGFSFDIPKFLTFTDCSFRILWCTFDHYSQYCKSYHPRLKIEPEEKENPEEEIKEEVEDKDGENMASNVVSPEAASPTELGVFEELKALQGDQSPPKEEEEPVEEEVVEDWPLPKTPDKLSYEDFDEYDDVVDLRAFGVLGGVFKFNLLQLPPQPKTVKSWTMTQLVTPPELIPMEYVVDTLSDLDLTASRETVYKKDDKPPLSIQIKIPRDVMVFDEPILARWDSNNKNWTTTGFSEPTYKEDERCVQCKLSVFGTMALLQDLHINMPFQSWELRPRGVNHCLLTIIAAIVELEIEIKDGLCCLVSPKNPELSKFHDKWMPPVQLIKEMKLAGINIFPSVDSYKYVSIQSKNTIVEQRIYFEMALTSSVFAFSWSKWNSETDTDKFVFQGTPSSTDEPVSEADLSLFLFTKKRFEKLKMTEFDEECEEFCDVRHPATEYACDIYHFIQSNCEEEVKNRLCEADILHTEAARYLFSSVQFLTFA